LTINKNIYLILSPWSAPTWMKYGQIYSNEWFGGTLSENMYRAFAYYFVVTIQKYKAEGIHITALTLQNEAQYEPYDYPGMRLSAQNETVLTKLLGPMLKANNLDTKIFVWDHNWDVPEYPLEILSDPVANQYVDGVAWHCYGGSVTAQTTVHDAYPDKEVWFTECGHIIRNATFAQNFQIQTDALYIGAFKIGPKFSCTGTLF